MKARTHILIRFFFLYSAGKGNNLFAKTLGKKAFESKLSAASAPPETPEHANNASTE